MKETLSQKLFTQPDGKRFAYADEIKKAVKKLNLKIQQLIYSGSEIYLPQVKLINQEIYEIFGKELS